MSHMIFVNLPVTDLPRAMAFYSAIGFTNEPRFTDDTAACMILTDSIFVMLLTHKKWASFTQRPIPPSDTSEVALAVTCEDRDAVNAMATIAGTNGGTVDINPAQDHGFMMSRSFADPDGHVWEPFWMDPVIANGDASVPEVTA